MWNWIFVLHKNHISKSENENIYKCLKTKDNFMKRIKLTCFGKKGSNARG